MFAMENRSSYEKLSIRDSARSLKKYGSTNRHVLRNENFIKHNVTSADTLQGIALRYSVTMEQIRRANRLWASDSLFLREHLLIPVPADVQVIVANDDSASKAAAAPSTSQITSSGSLDEDVNEFLEKIDASIASTKEEFRKTQGNSDFVENLDCPIERRKPATSRMKKTMNNNTSDLYTTPQAVVMTQGNKIKTSMKRYERQQDELFEL